MSALILHLQRHRVLMSPLLAVWRRSTQRLGAACRRAAVVFVAGLAWQVVWKRRVWYWDEQLWSQTTFFFFFNLQPVFFAKHSLESVCFMEHCHFVAMTKGCRMFFDESVATIFVFWPIRKTSGQRRSQPDDTQISCCILYSEALSLLLSRFQALKNDPVCRSVWRTKQMPDCVHRKALTGRVV